MTPEKVKWLWIEMQKYRTLFSDLTRGKVENYTALVTDPHSIWFEVSENETLIGVVYFTNMQQQIDCDAHLIFFDRKLPERVKLCQDIAQWMFANFPLNRITATLPRIYWATIKLAKAIGFKKEGVKRQSQIIGNRWQDEVILGLLRTEAASGRLD